MQKYLFYLFYSLKMLINQGFSNPPEQNRCAERMCYIVTDKELSQRAKDYFAQIRKTDRLIKRLTDTVFTLRSSLTSQSYELNPDKVQTSGPKNTLEETVAKIVDLEADINRCIDELVDMKQEAFTMINRIPDLLPLNLTFQFNGCMNFTGKVCLLSPKRTASFSGTEKNRVPPLENRVYSMR